MNLFQTAWRHELEVRLTIQHITFWFMRCRFIVPTRSAHPLKPIFCSFIYSNNGFLIAQCISPRPPFLRRRSEKLFFSAQCRPRLRHPQFCCFIGPFQPRQFHVCISTPLFIYFASELKVMPFRFCPYKIMCIFHLLRWRNELDRREYLAWLWGKNITFSINSHFCL